MAMNPAQMAGGQVSGQQPPPPSQTTQVAPGQAQVGGNMEKVIQAVGMAIQQAVDQQGYVDMNKLVTLWPQIAQQLGINIPFQTVMQLIKQNPSILENLVVRYGLSGMVVNGQRITAEQMAGQMTAGGGMS